MTRARPERGTRRYVVLAGSVVVGAVGAWVGDLIYSGESALRHPEYLANGAGLGLIVGVGVLASIKKGREAKR